MLQNKGNAPQRDVEINAYNWEHTRKTLGTRWEHWDKTGNTGNTLGTHWEHTGNTLVWAFPEAQGWREGRRARSPQQSSLYPRNLCPTCHCCLCHQAQENSSLVLCSVFPGAPAAAGGGQAMCGFNWASGFSGPSLLVPFPGDACRSGISE